METKINLIASKFFLQFVFSTVDWTNCHQGQALLKHIKAQVSLPDLDKEYS